MNIRKLLFTTIALTALLVGALPAQAAQTKPGTFTVVVETAPADLDPASSYDEFSNIPLRGIYEGLITLEGESLDKFTPVLAESYENQNDQTFTFKLRQNVKFHDGTTLDAAGVKASLTRTVRVELAASGILGTFLTNPERQIIARDASTLVFQFERPQPFFLYALAASYGAWIVSPTALSRNAGSDQAHTWLLTNAVGTGPYQLAAPLREDQPVTLRRFENYWRGWDGTHFDEIVIRTVPQSLLRRQALERGQADAATSLLPDDLVKLKDTNKYLINDASTLRLDYLILNTRTTWLQKPEVRQAMSYAFDYDAYNRAELGGLGKRTNGPFPLDLLGSDASTFRYPTDLKRARQLLTAANVPQGSKFVFAAPEGRGDIAGQILKMQIEQLGYELEIRKYDSDTYYNKIILGEPINGVRPDFMLQSWWPDYNSPLNFVLPIFAGASVGEAGQNAGYYVAPQVDQVIEQAKNARTRDEVIQLFKPFQTYITQQNPAGIYMAQAPDRTVVSGAIRGHVFNVLYLGTFDFYALSRG
jgi:peptide/nickel transport system substrate-binding protein